MKTGMLNRDWPIIVDVSITHDTAITLPRADHHAVQAKKGNRIA